MLSNFYYSPFEGDYGSFDSVEGFWYWLKLKNSDAPESEYEALRDSFGSEVKRKGKLLCNKYQDSLRDISTFEQDIKSAIKDKIMQNSELREELINSELQFDHYYHYEDNSRIKLCLEYKWITEEIEKIREELKNE